MNKNRTASGVLGLGYIVGATLTGGAEAAFMMGLFVILPLGCIWFSKPMGDYVGLVWRSVITSPTPAIVVCLAGWLLLLLPLVIWIVHTLFA